MNKSLDTNASAQEIIERMYRQDNLAQHFKMQLLEAKSGYAKLGMLVSSAMLNGHGICHGGITFSLADTAFAYACNSHNRKTVALTCHISFTQVVNEGDELIAVAQEIICNNRTGTYDVTIGKKDGSTVALFRGTSYSTKDPVISD